jgi:hypothetical protein
MDRQDVQDSDPDLVLFVHVEYSCFFGQSAVLYQSPSY